MQVTTDDLFLLLLFFLFILSFILLSVTHVTYYTILIYYVRKITLKTMLGRLTSTMTWLKQSKVTTGYVISLL